MFARLGFLLPLALFAAIAAALGIGLTLQPDIIPTVLKGKSVPEFDLPPLPDSGLGLSSTDLRAGEVVLVNVFASWCVSCRVEHPLLTALSESGVTVYGINYKDSPDDAVRWLETFGDPYRRIGVDRDGRIGIDWGVYGLPETFVVDGDGIIIAKHIGALTPTDIQEKILPAIPRAQR